MMLADSNYLVALIQPRDGLHARSLAWAKVASLIEKRFERTDVPGAGGWTLYLARDRLLVAQDAG